MADDKEMKRIADHVEILNGEVGTIQVDIAGIKVDITWLKNGLKWLMGLVGAVLLSAIAYAIFS